MDNVADDFVANISQLRNPRGEVVDIEQECFKWSMECKIFR